MTQESIEQYEEFLKELHAARELYSENVVLAGILWTLAEIISNSGNTSGYLGVVIATIYDNITKILKVTSKSLKKEN